MVTTLSPHLRTEKKLSIILVVPALFTPPHDNPRVVKKRRYPNVIIQINVQEIELR
jgi:hypothetical protein